MKNLTYLLLLATLVTLGNTPMGKPANEIVLTAKDVTSARDIEAAIIEVTNSGTRPGTVTLDSGQGQFYYTGDDRSINIFYSDITLRSLNKATIANCGDGGRLYHYPILMLNILSHQPELLCLHCRLGTVSYP